MTDYLRHIFSEAKQLQLSDFFLQENRPPHGRMSGKMLRLAAPVISNPDFAELWNIIGEHPQVGREIDSSFCLLKGERFRANIHHQLGEWAVVLRPIKTGIPSMAELGLPHPTLQSWAERPNGIVLITGATGSGKSTTAASMLQWINQHQSRHTITIEDPVEYFTPHPTREPQAALI